MRTENRSSRRRRTRAARENGLEGILVADFIDYMEVLGALCNYWWGFSCVPSSMGNHYLFAQA